MKQLQKLAEECKKYPNGEEFAHRILGNDSLNGRIISGAEIGCLVLGYDIQERLPKSESRMKFEKVTEKVIEMEVLGIAGFLYKKMDRNGKPYWIFTEINTGLMVGEGKTRKEAIDNAEEHIKNKGIDETKKIIESNIKSGEIAPKDGYYLCNGFEFSDESRNKYLEEMGKINDDLKTAGFCSKLKLDGYTRTADLMRFTDDILDEMRLHKDIVIKFYNENIK
jgi:hypothetical protein